METINGGKRRRKKNNQTRFVKCCAIELPFFEVEGVLGVALLVL
jgi:hypothetical protein